MNGTQIPYFCDSFDLKFAFSNQKRLHNIVWLIAIVSQARSKLWDSHLHNFVMINQMDETKKPNSHRADDCGINKCN